MKCPRVKLGGKSWYVHLLPETAGNNTRIYPSFTAAAIACFRYFDNNNRFPLITPLTFNKINVSSILISTLYWVEAKRALK